MKTPMVALVAIGDSGFGEWSWDEKLTLGCLNGRVSDSTIPWCTKEGTHTLVF